MKCINPIVLKSGLVVPCGKCELCRSSARSEWSVRLQLHTEMYDTMPLFVTLTYDNYHLTFADDRPVLIKDDIKAFLKRYRDGQNLYHTNWKYFGCGEYGDLFGRPHYHVLFFGDRQLYDALDRSEDEANELVRKYWHDENGVPLGFVKVCVADWSGIHYVTKYVMKHISEEDAHGYVMPFTFCSKGLGANWLKSKEAKSMKAKIRDFVKNHETYYDSALTRLWSDSMSLNEQIRVLNDVIDDLEHYIPSYKVWLPNMRCAPLPRYLKRKLIGSFEHFKDNPFWFYNSLVMLRDSMRYYQDYYGYDQEHDVPYSTELSISIRNKILSRFRENKNKKK